MPNTTRPGWGEKTLQALSDGVAIDGRFRTGLSKCFASAAGSILLAVFSVGSAGFVSICSTPILEQCKYLIDDTSLPVPETYAHSIIALCLTVVALLLVWLRELGLTDIARRKEADLERQRREMEGRLTNLPPRQFINDYVDALRTIGELRQLTKYEARTLSPETIVQRIRTIMSIILSLTRLWDGVSASNRFVTYHANIMRVLYRDEIALTPVRDLALGDEAQTFASQDPYALQNWLLQYEFFLHNQSYDVVIERCSGILFIQDTGLSVNSSCPGRPDASAEQICLPFTRTACYDPSFHHPNLPGPARAAATGQPGYVPNINETMALWFANQKITNSEINPRYEQQVKDYYRKLDHAKSLISLPLYHQGALIGVLNVSKNAENMLMNADRADLFVQLMNPVCYHLGKMLASPEAGHAGAQGVPCDKEHEYEN